MEYLSRLASMALKSKGSKIFTIQDGHEMTITPAGDGKTMNINIDDGASYKTKGVGDFIRVFVLSSKEARKKSRL